MIDERSTALHCGGVMDSSSSLSYHSILMIGLFWAVRGDSARDWRSRPQFYQCRTTTFSRQESYLIDIADIFDV